MNFSGKKCLFIGLLLGASVSLKAQSTANYGYSAEGKLLGVTSNRDSIILQWDALGRNTGKVLNGDSYLFGYNGQGLLSSYLDPKGLSTQYSYNGFGFPVSLSSPDTGFTSFTANLAGAVTQKATSGSITNITYDAEDRIASKTVSHPTLGSLTYSYSYGAQGSGYATGNLVSVSTTGQSISFEYNAFSDVTKKTQSVAGSATLSSQYSYSSPGLVSGVAYPSGRVATYSRDAAGQISGITVDGTTIVSNVLYSPHGVAGWTFGNGNSVTRTFDLEGRITSVTLATGTRSYSYDARGNITAITDSVLGNATYGYDNQNRLTSANTALGSWSYAYDVNGSRTQLGMNGGNYAVMVDSASNKALGYSTPTVRSLVYNNQGHVSNMTGDAATPACGNSMQLGYNANGSLTTSTAFDAVYDDFGFRLRKTAAACAGGAITLFNYGLNGFIQGEYANDGTPIQETVWLGDIPVAVFRDIKASEPAFYIYTDNLNTPRQIMNNSSQLVWSWDGEPFGATPANGSLSPVTTFTYNLRFPGQYYDQETGYHQNRWREYDPKQGKYLQSDPLGLAAGVNTYAYVEGNPLIYVDETGEIANFLFGGVTGFLTGYALAKLTGDECYGLQDALQDAAMGAIGAGVVSKLNKLYRIAKLRNIANSRGLQNVGKKGYTETWKNGPTTLEKLDIKFEAGKSPDLQAGSKVPRFAYRVDAGKFWDPFTGEVGPKGALSHVPLEPVIPLGASVGGAVSGGALEYSCGCKK